jgi:hypothetical protein
MVQATFQRPVWCSETSRALDLAPAELLDRAYFDCYFARFPEWYFRFAMSIPATLWAEARPGRRLMLPSAIETRLEKFQRLLEGYAWALAGARPEQPAASVHHYLLQALDRAAAGVEQLRCGDAYGALVRWQRAADFLAAIEEEPSAFRLRLLVDAESYAGVPSGAWPPHLDRPQ